MANKLENHTFDITHMTKTHGGDTAWHAGVPEPQGQVYHDYVQSYRNAGANVNWRYLIKNGLDATTPLTGEQFSFETDPIKCRASVNVYGNPTQEPGHTSIAIDGSHYVTNPSAMGLPPSSVSGKAENRAATQFYKNLERQFSLISGGTVLGELAETVRMIKSPAKALRSSIDDYLSHLKKGRRGSRQRKREFLADSWLEYSFGWAPFVSDINDALEYTSKRQTQLAKKQFFVSGSGEASDSDSSVFDFGSTAWKAQWTNIHTYSAGCRYFAAISAEANLSRVTVQSSLGLSPRHFVPTLWELMPWSFLIDYFTNIGDVISAASQGSVRFAWGYQTTGLSSAFSTRAHGVYVQPPSNYFFYSHDPHLGRTEALRRVVSRQSIASVPVPSVSFEIPGSSLKWLNIAALAKRGAFKLPF